MQKNMYDILYYIYVLFFGVYISVRLACGSVGPKERRLISVLCPVLLMAQGIFLQLWGIDTVQKLYPAIVHLPLTVAMPKE